MSNKPRCLSDWMNPDVVSEMFFASWAGLSPVDVEPILLCTARWLPFLALQLGLHDRYAVSTTTSNDGPSYWRDWFPIQRHEEDLLVS